MLNHEFTKTKLHHKITFQLINRSLQYYIMRQLVHPHCGMQPYRLPYDNPLSDKKTATVAIHFLFSDIMLKIQFPMNITFRQWNRI